MQAIGFLLQRLRQERLPAALLVVLVLLTAFGFAAAPRLFNRVADAGLRHEIGSATAVERSIQLAQVGRIRGVATSGLQPIAAAGEQLEADLPDSIRALITGRSLVVESARWAVREPPAEQPSYITFRFQDGAEDRVEIVEGRAPTGETEMVDIPGTSTAEGVPEQGVLFEAALSVQTAEELFVAVGDRLHLSPDADDALVGQFGAPDRAAVEIVGLLEIHEPDAPYWLNDSSLELSTIIPVTLDTRLIYGTALMSPDAYAPLTRMLLPMRYSWRYFLDPQGFDAGRLEQVVADLRRMQSSYATFTSGRLGHDATTLQTGLLELMDRYLAERRTAQAVLTAAAMGPAAIAAAAIGLLTLLIAQRRRRALALVRGRGGSVPQVIGSHVLEGLLLALPPSAVAYLVAAVVIDSRATALSPLAAAIVAGVTTVLIVAAATPMALFSLGRLDRDDAAPLAASPRRLAFEGLAVVLAVGGVVLLRERGLAGGSAAADLEGVDPFLAVVPVLIGVAVGLVTVRLFPYPARLAGWVAAGGRGLVPSLGLRRASRQANAGHLPLIVLLLTVAIGGFSSTMLVTIERGQTAAVWQEVGAAYQVSAGGAPLPSDLDLASVDGVEAAAGVHLTDALGRRAGQRLALLAIDASDYAEVTAGTPADADLPASLLAAPVPGDEEEEPIPAIVSRAMALGGAEPLRRGDEFELMVRGRSATFRVVEIRDRFSGAAPGSSFAVVAREQLRGRMADRALLATAVFARASVDAAGALRAELAVAAPAATLQSQAERADELRSGPLVQAVAAGFGLAVVVALAYAAMAMTIALLLAAAARARETAQLRTMGITRRQVIGLGIMEHGPEVIVALVAGLALGIGIASLIQPGLGLAALIGSEIEVALEIDPLHVTLLLGVLLMIVSIGIGVSAWLQRRMDPARSVREGLE
ncbi:MAG: FtsX-like permease family protein [Candidatus Limnocylindria bacterium]